MMAMKEAVRRVVSGGIVCGGISALGRRFRRRDGAMIFYGHRVTDRDEGYLESLRPAWLEDQVAYLARHYEIIPLSTLVRCFEKRTPVPQNSVVLTFDDGFRDNLEHAFPILERYQVPATIFLVTGAVASGQLPWSQRLGYLVEHTDEPSIDDPLVDRPLDLSTSTRRRQAYERIKQPLRGMSRVPREEALERLGRRLKVDPPKDQMLTWDDARLMMSRGIIVFGAHTYSHPLLARIPLAEAEWEMSRSRDDLREHLGIEQPAFCFPGGSYDDELVSQVRALGFRSVFRPHRGVRLNNLETADAFSLSRMGLPNAPRYVLEAETDGPMNYLRQWIRPRRAAGTGSTH